jgi:hypothetical protein
LNLEHENPDKAGANRIGDLREYDRHCAGRL